MDRNDIFDNLSKAATDALSSVSGVKEDVGNFVKARVEHVLSDLEIVQREEFEALKLMVINQAAEIEELKAKLDDSQNS